MDRATVRKRLRGVPPDGRSYGHPAWRLGTALPYLRSERRPEPDDLDDPDAVPPCIAALGGPFTCDQTPPNVVSEAIAVALLAVAEEIPVVAAKMAVAAGCDMRTAFLIWQAMSCGIIGYCRHRGESYGLKWRNPEWFVLPEQPDWESLAEEAGEPVDVDAWKEYSSRRQRELYGEGE